MHSCVMLASILQNILLGVIIGKVAMAALLIGTNTKSLLKAEIGALLLDCDGTIAETERELTLVQFNCAFKATDEVAHIQWTSSEYGELLKAGASQARFTSYFEKHGWPASVQSGMMGKPEFVDYMKRQKDDMFDVVWGRGEIQLLPGVMRLIDEALDSGVKVAVCSNSNLEPVTKICLALLGQHRVAKMLILTGDMPEFKQHKKPDPKIYLHAASVLGVPPSRCVAVEDSYVGLQAAKRANMRCIVTPSYYTTGEDFGDADLVASDLDAGGVRIVKLDIDG